MLAFYVKLVYNKLCLIFGDLMKIYGLIGDCGDGSACLHWFKDEELVDILLEDGPEYWGLNEGSPAETLIFPDDFDFSAAGFRFSDED